ncbi:MAG: FtsQ-type POTRA domain-containing protein [Patescibacteria group bacterium]|nr:FtsQ-type POTRA domain-containing protein [Patescibacteria group bacterium]
MFGKNRLPKSKVTSNRATAKFRRKRAGKKLFSSIKIQKRKTKLVFANIVAQTLRNKIVRILIIGIVLALLILGGRYFIFSDRFDIKNIQIEGCEQLQTSLLDDKLAYLYGVNIFLVRSSTLKGNVVTLSPYIKDLKVEKHLPDTVYINIIERKPSLVWVNLSGAYLVDQEGTVLRMVLDYEDLVLDQEDIDLLKGYGDLSAVEEEKPAEKKKSSEEEVEKEELTNKEKQKIIEEGRKEVVSRVDQFWGKNLKNLGDEYKAYPFVYNYVPKSYMVLDNIDLSLMKSSRTVINLDLKGEVVLRYVWESEYRFVLYLKDDRKIIFSTRRELEEQIYDLDVFLADLKAKDKKFQYIDLSSEIIVYEFEE